MKNAESVENMKNNWEMRKRTAKITNEVDQKKMGYTITSTDYYKKDALKKLKTQKVHKTLKTILCEIKKWFKEKYLE